MPYFLFRDVKTQKFPLFPHNFLYFGMVVLGIKSSNFSMLPLTISHVLIASEKTARTKSFISGSGLKVEII